MTDSEPITAYEVDREQLRELADDGDGEVSDGTTGTDTLAEHCRFDYEQSDTRIGPDDGEPDELTDDSGEVVRDVEELVPPARDPCDPATRSQRRRAVRRFEGESDG